MNNCNKWYHWNSVKKVKIVIDFSRKDLATVGVLTKEIWHVEFHVKIIFSIGSGQVFVTISCNSIFILLINKIFVFTNLFHYTHHHSTRFTLNFFTKTQTKHYLTYGLHCCKIRLNCRFTIIQFLVHIISEHVLNVKAIIAIFITCSERYSNIIFSYNMFWIDQ